LQTVIEFAPVESAGAIEAPRHVPRLRLLPSVDSTGLAGFVEPLRAEAALIVLPLAPAQSLNSQIRRFQPDIVLIASQNPSTTPWRNDSSLLHALSTTPALLLTPGITSTARQLAADLGIASVLPQDLQHRQLLAAIQAVAAGLAVTLPSAAGKAAEPDSTSERSLRDIPLVEQLTPREKTVLDRMAHGCGNKEIAAQLGISEHTAKFHVSSILAKLGATSRTEAVTIGILTGLVAI
jgi:DNA-binding NarL/FixJ family response regulator